MTKKIFQSFIMLIGFLILAAASPQGAKGAQQSVFDPDMNWLIIAYDGTTGILLDVFEPGSDDTLGDADVAIDGCPSLPCQLVTGSVDDWSLSYNPQEKKVIVLYSAEGYITLVTKIISSLEPVLSVSPPSIAFGDTDVGTSKQETITVSNIGSSAVTGLSIDGPQTPFSMYSSCPDALEPDNSCQINVSFAPVDVGSFNGQVTISSSDTGTKTVGLTGNGIYSGLPADLLITRILRPSMIGKGRAFPMRVTIKNQGAGDASSCTIKLYMSKDKVIDSGDELFYTGSVPALASGVEYERSLTGRVYHVYTHQSYYILVHIDADDDVPESDENNNIRFTTTYVY